LGELRLDSREAVLKGGKSGPAVVAGAPEKSLLIQAVTHRHERLKMPPAGKLKESEIADLIAWVRQGAIWPEKQTAGPAARASGSTIKPEQRNFWAFQPVRKPEIPSVKHSQWPQSPVDRFILAKLEENGLEPAPPADKRTLIRRATFDLTGLPPTPEEVEAFATDQSPNAFRAVVDRLLASPRYGERWGRYWLALARYADARVGAFTDDPAPHAFHYRDWVIHAFNEDLRYDTFVKAQIAADLMPEAQRAKLMAGLGFQALGHGVSDQVDVTTRVFLGLTVGCAQCHDHKFDPIPTKDYYSLFGVFRSSEAYDFPLAPESVVNAYKEHKKKLEAMRETIDEFVEKQNLQLGLILAEKTSRYMIAAWELRRGERNAVALATEQRLDEETLGRWADYLKTREKEHPYLKEWFELVDRGAPKEEARRFADAFQQRVLAVLEEKKGIDDRNYVTLGGAKGVKDEKTRQYANLEFLDVDKYYLWRDLFADRISRKKAESGSGIYYYGDKQLGRWLHPEAAEYLAGKLAEHDALKKSLPEPYPALYTVREGKEPKNVRVQIRGEAKNLGEEAPRRFLSILCDGEPAPFQKGSGRLELAEAIASAANPLTARVMVNRLWEMHFGQGIVRTPSNFGQLGDRPSHPELLDYLAARFVENGWSVKAMHREILLTAAYRMSARYDARNMERDPENKLLWRANLLPRLDAEALRDSILAVTGKLDLTMGGPAFKIPEKKPRRTVYAYVSRNRLDDTLALFDFPDPNATTEQRLITNGPLQRLFFLNSDFIAEQASALVQRLAREAGESDLARLQRAYLLLYARPPSEAEMKLGLKFVGRPGGWNEYAQVLLSTNEFSAVN
jgi:cytochrome c553